MSAARHCCTSHVGVVFVCLCVPCAQAKSPSRRTSTAPSVSPALVCSELLELYFWRSWLEQVASVLLVCLCQLITAARWARRPSPTAPLPLTTTTDTWVSKRKLAKEKWTVFFKTYFCLFVTEFCLFPSQHAVLQLCAVHWKNITLKCAQCIITTNNIWLSS